MWHEKEGFFGPDPKKPPSEKYLAYQKRKKDNPKKPFWVGIFNCYNLYIFGERQTVDEDGQPIPQKEERR